jgi:large subunit ribosomal protein L31
MARAATSRNCALRRPCRAGIGGGFARPVGIGGAISVARHKMKAGIHPEYHEITVVMTDGTQYQTRSCYGKAGDTLRLDVDPKSHPAWTGVQRIMDTGGQVAKFNKKFAGIGLKKGT